MEEAESKEAVRLRSKASKMLKRPSSTVRPSWKEHKSSYFLTKSLAEMVNRDPIRLQNQSSVIREEIVKFGERGQLIHSSLARLPTFSIGLSSTQSEDPPRAPLRESSVVPKNKFLPRFFQMPELGARVFVGEDDGFDTIACYVIDSAYQASDFHRLDSEYAAVRSLCKDDRPGRLSGCFRGQPIDFWGFNQYSGAILSGTELIVGPSVHVPGLTMVGNLRGNSSRVSGSSSEYKDCTSDKTMRQPSDIVSEQPADPVPSVRHYWRGHWASLDGSDLWRSTKGSYLKKPKFMKTDDGFQFDPSKGDVLQLTRFDDFVILGNQYLNIFLRPHEAIDIVQKNASKTADVIAAQLVKGAIENNWVPLPNQITAIVIFLDHKEILLREHKKEKKENMAQKYKAKLLGLLRLKTISQSTILRDNKKIAKLKEEEKIATLKEEKKITTLKKEKNITTLKEEDKKGIIMEEDHKVQILLDELLPNVLQISTISLEENELGMKPKAMSSKLTEVEVQDGFEASSSIVLTEDDDCNNEDLKVFCHMTKWIIYGDLLERTLLCFFNMEEMQYEFYFEDYESMATIIGLGVPHSKVVLECGSSHVTVVEIPEEDWDVVWVHSNYIPRSSPKGYVLKQDRFPDILHRIANIINANNIIRKANHGGTGGDNGKGKAQGNADDNKGKSKAGHDHVNDGNTSHSDGGSNGVPDDNDKKERKEKDGNNEKKDNCDRDDGKISNDCKEVKVVVHLRLLPGGVLEDKEKKKELAEGHKEEVEGKIKELREGCKGVEKKKNKNLKSLLHALKRGENGNVIGNQQKSTTIKRVENGEVDEDLQKQLENQILSQMVFTFTIKDEAGGLLKTIQVTIDPITFQFPSNNEENYLQKRRFGWFHEKLQVAFGVVDTQVAFLDAKSHKVLDSFEAKEVNLQGNSKENARTTIHAYKGEMGIKHGLIANGAYGRTNGLEAKTTEEVHNSWETNKTFTKGGFLISDRTDHISHQLKYSYCPLFPFNEKEFEVKDEGDRLKMYDLNPICQLQQVSCEGTWHPYDSEKLEAYKLEASRELRMTRIYNLELETGEEKKQKGVLKVEKSLPLCFIQMLEKVVYLNHAMSHLTSSTTGVYRLQEQQNQSNQSVSFLTQAQYRREPKWPSNDPLVALEHLSVSNSVF